MDRRAAVSVADVFDGSRHASERSGRCGLDRPDRGGTRSEGRAGLGLYVGRCGTTANGCRSAIADDRRTGRAHNWSAARARHAWPGGPTVSATLQSEYWRGKSLSATEPRPDPKSHRLGDEWGRSLRIWIIRASDRRGHGPGLDAGLRPADANGAAGDEWPSADRADLRADLPARTRDGPATDAGAISAGARTTRRWSVLSGSGTGGIGRPNPAVQRKPDLALEPTPTRECNHRRGGQFGRCDSDGADATAGPAGAAPPRWRIGRRRSGFLDGAN